MQLREGKKLLARGDGQGAFAPDVSLLDRPSCEERARDADDAQDDFLLTFLSA